MKQSILLTCAGAVALASSLNAGELRLYDSLVNPGMHNFDLIKGDPGGTLYGITWGAMITPDNPMGNPAGFRIWSLENGNYSRADATAELPTPLKGGIRVSFRAINQNYFWIASGLRKLSLRIANPNFLDSINSSSANYQNMLEIMADGTVSGAWNWYSDVPRGTPGGGPTRYITDPGGGVPVDDLPAGFALAPHRFDLIINASETDNFSYVLFGVARTLHPLRIDMFIDGVLATPDRSPNGTQFEDKNGFDPALGIATFSFTTASATHAETDFIIDQAYVYWDDSVNDGSVALTPYEIILNASDFIEGDTYSNPVLGNILAFPPTDWLWASSTWIYPVNANASGYWFYHANADAWVFAPASAQGMVYIYDTGWVVWGEDGSISAI